MSKKHERECTTDLARSLRSAGAFFYKIPDMPQFAGAQTRFNPAKPFDAVCVYRGIAVAIEVKWMSEFAAFGRQLREGQIEGLQAWDKAGGWAIVVLFVTLPRQPPMMMFFSWKEYGNRFLLGKSVLRSELLMIPAVHGVKSSRLTSSGSKASYWSYPVNGLFSANSTALASSNSDSKSLI